VEGLAGPLRLMGAEVIEAPAIRIEPPTDVEAADAAIGRLREFDWVVFTSANGVEAFFARLGARLLDARALGGVKVAAVGPGTAGALRARYLNPDLEPDEFTTRALGQALLAAGAGRGTPILLCRAEDAGAELPEMLRSAGAAVQEAPVYRTTCPEKLPEAAEEALRTGRVDWITFTSVSTVENVLRLAAGMDLGKAKLAAIGPVTAEALRRKGLTPAAVAQPHTIEGLLTAILAAEQAIGQKGRRT